MTYKLATSYGRIGTARSANLAGYWKFDGDLTDSGPNGIDLTRTNGTTRWTKIGNLTAVKLVVETFESSAFAALNIAGAMSFHILFCPSGKGEVSEKSLFLVHNPAVSTQYNLSMTDYTPQLKSDIQSPTRINELQTFSPTTGVPVLISLTRDASENVNWYINGEDYGPGSGPVSDNGAAANCELYINHTRHSHGAIAELQILNIELTAAQVLEDAKKVMPWL